MNIHTDILQSCDDEDGWAFAWKGGSPMGGTVVGARQILGMDCGQGKSFCVWHATTPSAAFRARVPGWATAKVIRGLLLRVDSLWEWVGQGVTTNTIPFQPVWSKFLSMTLLCEWHQMRILPLKWILSFSFALRLKGWMMWY